MLKSSLSNSNQSVAGMAGTFVDAPNGFELVGDPVPTAQHWLTLPTRPVDFDANSVWAYVQKLKKIESGKPFSLCVFCLKTFGSYNATKMSTRQLSRRQST